MPGPGNSRGLKIQLLRPMPLQDFPFYRMLFFMADLINTLASNLSIAGVRSNVTAKTNVDGQAPAVEGAVKADLSKIRTDGQATAVEAADVSSNESQQVKQLREQVKELQKQLAEAQKQLQQAMASKEDERTKAVRVAAAQAAVTTVTGQLLQATAALLQALTDEGGSSAGSSVNTTA